MGVIHPIHFMANLWNWIKQLFNAAAHPVPAIGKSDTSLRYTDILFGFVIKEFFVRLQNIQTAPCEIQLQLITGIILVLGSWIGYRRSLNRFNYEVKFFNLPLCRFVADQLMLICYFYAATMTDDKVKASVPPDLSRRTTQLLMIVFALYLIWDFLGIRMTKASISTPPDAGNPNPRYPEIKGDTMMSDSRMPPDWKGFLITLVFGLALCLLYFAVYYLPPCTTYIIAIIILLSYRMAKETRTTLRPSS
jgi:hypothetical protein